MPPSKKRWTRSDYFKLGGLVVPILVAVIGGLFMLFGSRSTVKAPGGYLVVVDKAVIINQYQQFTGQPLTDENKRLIESAVNLAKAGEFEAARPLFERLAAAVPVPAVLNSQISLQASARCLVPLAVEPTSQAALAQLFPASKDLNVLVDPFRTDVRRFLSALSSAGAAVAIASTYEPPERRYIEHYAFLIAREGVDPTTVPAMKCLEFEWKRKAADGSYSLAESRKLAESIVQGLGLVLLPPLISRHTEGLAIDMTISWAGALKVLRGDSSIVVINSLPRSGGNSELWEVGKSYNVLKLANDPPHWSTDGH